MRNPLFWGVIIGSFMSAATAMIAIWRYNIDASHFLTIIGTVVTAVAFGFGTYFAALAVDAYSQLALVRKTTDSVAENAKSVSEVYSRVQVSEGEITKAFASAKIMIDEIEEDAFARLEGVMGAVVAYAQKMPSSSEKNKQATQELIIAVKLIRNTYICEKAKNPTKVASALLDFSQTPTNNRKSIVEKVRDRFPDNTEIRALCETLLREC